VRGPGPRATDRDTPVTGVIQHGAPRAAPGLGGAARLAAPRRVASRGPARRAARGGGASDHRPTPSDIGMAICEESRRHFTVRHRRVCTRVRTSSTLTHDVVVDDDT
jgi:hypothetical protein